MRKKHTKSKLVTIAILLLLLSIAGTGTLAYFNDSITVHNEITTGKINIAINQVTTSSLAVMPSMSVEHSIVVTNKNTSSDAWVRVKIEKEITLADNQTKGNAALIAMTYNQSNTYNQQDWDYKDGYYYYKTPLVANNTTVPLFDKIVFSPSMGNEYQNSKATVTIHAQAVQTAHNGSTVLEAEGWPN